MDLKEIKLKVKDIEKEKDDDEVAHSLEDQLYQDFVDHIAKTGNNEQRRMARAVLRTNKIDFARLCA
jgi:hypothetical protein